MTRFTAIHFFNIGLETCMKRKEPAMEVAAASFRMCLTLTLSDTNADSKVAAAVIRKMINLTNTCYKDGPKALSRVTSTGAMTFCFIQAIERRHAQTYGNLLCAMRDAIRTTNVNSGMGAGPVTSLLEMLVSGGSTAGGLTQEPQLTASDMFNINTPFYL